MDEDEQLPSPQTDDGPAILEELRSEALGYIVASKSANTRKSYASDWADFTQFCNHQERISLPAAPETVALYITHRARSLRTSSLERRLAAIGDAHRSARQVVPTTDPTFRAVWAGIRREKGTAKRRKNPTLTKLIKKMLTTLPENLLGTRDRALILLGYAGAFRRSELVSLNVGDLELVEEGFVVNIRKSKTDQTGNGRTIGVPYGKYEHTCPVRAVQRWMVESGISAGPLFRSVNRHGQVGVERLGDRTVAQVVKRTLRASGIDPRDFAGHSLRSGFATMASREGALDREVQNQTGHKSVLVLRRYIHDGRLFQNSAARKLGL